MTEFVSNLIKKFQNPTFQTDPIIIKPDSKTDLISSDSIFLNEEVTGDVYCLKEVTVDKIGDLTGNIYSKRCIVNGRVNGNILSTDYIEVKNTAIIEGNIKSGSIQIEAGSIINGFVSIEKKIKLPAIIKKMAEELSVKGHPHKADPPEKAQSIISNTPLVIVAEEPEIIREKETPVIEPDRTIEIIQDVPIEKIEVVPDLPIERTELVTDVPTEKKEIPDTPTKKKDSKPSNDSWW